jgi:hypothetical protein
MERFLSSIRRVSCVSDRSEHPQWRIGSPDAGSSMMPA